MTSYDEENIVKHSKITYSVQVNSFNQCTSSFICFYRNFKHTIDIYMIAFNQLTSRGIRHRPSNQYTFVHLAFKWQMLWRWNWNKTKQSVELDFDFFFGFSNFEIGFEILLKYEDVWISILKLQLCIDFQ